MKFRPLLLVVVALTFGLVACGGKSDDDDDQAVIDAPGGAIDAPMQNIDAAGGTNALGTVCSFASPQCPAGNTCTGVQGLGSTTMGWCSPMCMNMNSICTTGYTGPAGGMPVCALSTAMGAPPSLCAIVCTMQSQCPTGLTCTQVPNQNAMICAPPP
jgi:hypothetical protein